MRGRTRAAITARDTARCRTCKGVASDPDRAASREPGEPESGDGDPLGLAGFGASGHLVLQLAHHRFPASPIYVFARNEVERDFARQLGAGWTGDFGDEPPSPMGAVIDTTPAWKPIVDVLRHVMPGGRLVINAIRKSSTDQRQLLAAFRGNPRAALEQQAGAGNVQQARLESPREPHHGHRRHVGRIPPLRARTRD